MNYDKIIELKHELVQHWTRVTNLMSFCNDSQLVILINLGCMRISN